jgi:two-component system C4-dicarboxylate transport response regulator DctD
VVVLVEDDVLLLRAWRRLLAGLPIRLRCFGAAERALEAVRAERAAVVVTDHHMPGMSGLELIEHVRAGDLAREVLLVTSDEAALLRAAQRGVRALDKSCGAEPLRSLVETLLAGRSPPAAR